MTLTAIILLIILGIILVIIEFFIVPGITVAGVLGFLVLVSAIVLTYYNYESSTGNLILAGILLFLGISIAFAFRAKTWDKISLKTEITKKVNTEAELKVKKGDEGITVSRLAPMGKILINNEYFEAKTQNRMIDENQNITVVKIKNKRIIVKLTD